MSVVQVSTGWDGTAYEVREGEVIVWVDGLARGVQTNKSGYATMSELRSACQALDLQSFMKGHPAGLPPRMEWKTYPRGLR